MVSTVPSQINNNIPEQSTSSQLIKRPTESESPVIKQKLFAELHSESDTDDTSDDDGISSINLRATKLYSELCSNALHLLEESQRESQSLNCILPEGKRDDHSELCSSRRESDSYGRVNSDQVKADSLRDSLREEQSSEQSSLTST